MAGPETLAEEIQEKTAVEIKEYYNKTKNRIEARIAEGQAKCSKRG